MDRVSAAWYDGTTRTVVTSQTAVWYRSGKPPVPLRWVWFGTPKANSLPRPALHRSVGGPGADPGMVCAALATGGPPGGAGSPGRGDASGRPGHCPYYANPDGSLLLDHPGGPSAEQRPSAHRTAAWYAKPSPTFVDAIALVRRHLWLASEGFSLSAADPDIRKVPAALYHRLVDSLAYAA